MLMSTLSNKVKQYDAIVFSSVSQSVNQGQVAINAICSIIIPLHACECP